MRSDSTKIIGLAIIAIWSLQACSDPPAEGVIDIGCRLNSDCGVGEVCEEGQCVESGECVGEDCPCIADGDCGSGEGCDLETGECFALECLNDGDCALGELCAQGRCETDVNADRDLDGVPDNEDLCPDVANADQEDNDIDGQGDACDLDDDNDAILDTVDNCQFVANLDQSDSNSDGIGNACDEAVRGTTVEGLVDASAGLNPNPADALVFISSREESVGLDGEGRFVFDQALTESGVIGVRVEWPGFVTLERVFEVEANVERRDLGTFVLVPQAEDDEEAVDLVGRVALEDEAEPSNVVVRARVNGALLTTTLTDGEGNYAIRTGPLDHEIEFNREGYQTRSVAVLWDEEEARFELDGAPLAEAIVVLSPDLSARASGTLVSSLENIVFNDIASVSLVAGERHLATVEAGGDFQVDSLRPGLYALQVEARGHLPVSLIVRLDPGDNDLGEVVLTPEFEDPDRAVTLRSTAALSDGALPEGIVVRARIEGSLISSTLTDGNGTFAFLASRLDHTLEFSKTDYQSASVEVIWSEARDRFEIDGEDIDREAPIATLVPSPPVGTIRVKVSIVPDWIPAEQRHVSVSVQGEGYNEVQEQVFHNIEEEEGVAFLAVPTGSFLVRASRPGFTDTQSFVRITTETQEIDVELAVQLRDLDDARLDLRDQTLNRDDLIQARDLEVDFRNADLSGVRLEGDLSGLGLDFSGVDLSNANLQGTDLSDMRLVGASFFGANLADAVLTGANLRGADMTLASLRGAQFRGEGEPLPEDPCDLDEPGPSIQLTGARFSQAELDEADLSGVDLRGTDLGGAGLTRTNLSRTCLEESNLTLADLTETDLTRADMSDASLTNAILRQTTLRGAILEGANLTGAIMERTDLSCESEAHCTNLVRANLNGANLVGANFEGADLEGASLLGVVLGSDPEEGTLTSFVDASLRSAQMVGLIFNEVDMSGADMSDASLSNSVFSGAILDGVRFIRADMTQVSMVSQTLEGADFTEATLEAAELTGSVFVESIFEGALFTSARLNRADLSGALMGGADLRGADLSEALMDLADLEGTLAYDMLDACPTTLPDESWRCLRQPANDRFALFGDRVSLSGADLSGLTTGLEGVSLEGADLSGAVMAEIGLSGAFLAEANLSGADLSEADLSGTDLSDSEMLGTTLLFADLTGADLSRADLEGADLTSARLIDATVTDVALNDADLQNTQTFDLQGECPEALPDEDWSCRAQPANGRLALLGPIAFLSGADLSGADLSETNVSGANLTNANLSGADMSGINAADADFNNADLSGVNATGADLSGANLNLVRLQSADLSGADLTGATVAQARTGTLTGCPASLPNGDYSCLAESDNESVFIVGPEVRLDGADLRGLALEGVNFEGVGLTSVPSFDLVSCPDVLPDEVIWRCRAQPANDRFVLLGPLVNLSGADLSGMDFDDTRLTGTNMTGTILSGARTLGLSGCPSQLPDNNWRCIRPRINNGPFFLAGPGLDLSGADLSAKNNLDGLNLRDGDFTDALMNNSNFRNTNFTSSDLSGARLHNSDLRNTNFTTATASDTDVSNSELDDAVLTQANFSGADFIGADLLRALATEANFSGTDMEDANLRFTNFTGANLSEARLVEVDLAGASLEGADFTQTAATQLQADCPASLPSDQHVCEIQPTGGLKYIAGPGVKLVNIFLRGASLPGINLSGANLTQADFLNTDLTGADFRGADLTDTVFGENTDATGADFRGVLVSNTLFRFTNFTSARFDNSDLRTANFTSANLTSALLSSSNLTGVDFTGANLTSASLSRSDLTGANMTNTDLTGASLVRTNVFDLVSCPAALPSDDFGCRAQPATGGFAIFGLAINTVGADLSDADLRGLSMSDMDMTRVNLTGADLDGADMTRVNLTDALTLEILSCPAILPSSFSCVPLSSGNFALFGDKIDLSGVDLSNQDLSGIRLRNANLQGADLTGSDLTGADLLNALTFDLVGCPATLPNETSSCVAQPANARFVLLSSGVRLDGADLSGADLSGLNLSSITMTGTNLEGVDLTDADLTSVKAHELPTCPDTLPTSWACVLTPNNGLFILIGPGARLPDVDIQGANLGGLDLTTTNLRRSQSFDIDGGCPSAITSTQDGDSWRCLDQPSNGRVVLAGPRASFIGADLDGVDFSNIDLNRVPFTGASLVNANLSGTNLNQVILHNADLTGADLSGITNLGGSAFNGNTICPDGQRQADFPECGLL